MVAVGNCETTKRETALVLLLQKAIVSTTIH